jgi:hypothetical protein
MDGAGAGLDGPQPHQPVRDVRERGARMADDNDSWSWRNGFRGLRRREANAGMGG